ncbi:MAG: thrombospondin type 3 repeat-containing protein [Candidatus Pacebacteria bacterium]|nr:thrombospondin type 3 repeat-containing protein [Candidatus Paceibacterota bacterium]
MFLDTDTFNIKNQWINYNSLYNNQIKNIDSRDLEAIEKLQNNFWKKLEIVKLIEITETLNEEKINNQKNYHYRYVLNSKNIIKEIIKTYLETTEMPDWQKNWQELEKELEEVEFLDSYILGEIWINKNSLYLTKITGKIQGLKNEEYLEQGDIKALSFSLELFNIDKNQNIQAPEKSIDLETLLEKMGMNNNFLKNINNNLLKNTNNPSPTFWQNQENQEFFTEKLDMNSDLDSDNDGLSDFQEEYLYFSDPLNTDTDGDGYSDKEEVDNNFNPNGPGKLQ